MIELDLQKMVMSGNKLMFSQTAYLFIDIGNAIR